MNYSEIISNILNTSFFARLFSWNRITAYLGQLLGSVEAIATENDSLSEANTSLISENKGHVEGKATLAEENRALGEASKILKATVTLLEPLKVKNDLLQEEVNEFKQTENTKKQEHEAALELIGRTQSNLTAEIERRETEEAEAEEEKHERIKKTWKLHEDQVQNTMLGLCELLGITYVDSFPYEGKAPDNVIEIVNDHIIFDAKSPANESLDNFPTYLKTQVAKLGKYAKLASVHKHLYLVIPSNTVEVVRQKTFRDSNYTVHIITLDSLETILVTLKKIEEYDYTEKLSPEDREGIARMLSGLMSHSKRTVQVNTFFNEWLLRFIKENAGRVPADIMKEAELMEKGTRINPGNQATNKLIDIDEEFTKNEAVKTIAFNQVKVKQIEQLNIKEGGNDEAKAS